MKQISANQISIFPFPEEEENQIADPLMSKLPFAVVGSNVIVTNQDGERVRGRRYPWGTVNIENEVGYNWDFGYSIH